MKYTFAAALVAALMSTTAMSARADQTVSVDPSKTGFHLNVMSANLTLRHEKRADVQVTTNYPEHWQIAGGVIRQTAAQTQTSVGGISISRNRVTITIGNHTWSSDDTTAGGAPTENKPLDAITVVVPENYRGGLDLVFNGVQDGTVDGWYAGKVDINNDSTSALHVGTIDTPDGVKLANSGVGTMTIGSVHAADLVGTNSSTSEVHIGSVSASTVEVTNNGIGNFSADRLEATATRIDNSSTGNLVLGELDTQSLDAVNSGVGGINIQAGQASAGHANNSGIGDIVLHGQFNVSQDASGLGEIRN